MLRLEESITFHCCFMSRAADQESEPPNPLLQHQSRQRKPPWDRSVASIHTTERNVNHKASPENSALRNRPHSYMLRSQALSRVECPSIRWHLGKCSGLLSNYVWRYILYWKVCAQMRCGAGNIRWRLNSNTGSTVVKPGYIWTYQWDQFLDKQNVTRMEYPKEETWRRVGLVGTFTTNKG